jgi:hypothetical protein
MLSHHDPRSRQALRCLLLVLLLLGALSTLGCDCGEGDTQSAFGPECCCDDNTTATDEADGGSAGGGTGTLIFSDVAANSIRRFENISELDTAVVTAPPLTGSTTRMTRPGYLSIHPTSNQLIVCDEGSIAVLFFDDPLSINGDVPPTRVLTGANTQMVAPVQAYVDSENDELYVLDRGGNQILVYPGSASIDADVAPLRKIGGPASGISNPSAFIVRPSIDQLTVICPTEVLTFTDFRNINGDVDPAGRVSGDATTFQNLTYGEFDSSNSLILVDRGTASILYFEAFEFDQNNQAPTHIIQGGNTGIAEPGQFVLTSSGNMYLANGQNVLFFEAVRDLEGNPFPDRKFSALDPPSQTIKGLLAP